MPRRAALSSLVLVLLSLSEPAAAETVTPAGPRVRVTAPSHLASRLVGTLIAEDTDSLRIAVGTRVVTVPRNAVARLEFSQAPSGRGRGAARGFALGAAAGAALGFAVGDDDDGGGEFCSFDGCATFGPILPKPMGALIGGAFFGALGAGVGALVAHGERWESQPEQRVRFSVGPAPGRGVAARLAIRFGGRR